ncbi:MFS transporter [Pigmentibacter ruber]|uniref:MFS transporter n=1 Tax=Pigmentibacter ruber TaxID=2683196 RepID=UPI00131B5405|nr:MFS transporter [Pigmentibacter ruber]BFD31972.1 MFS transporter [Pigmentibacter ruber]
MKSLFPIFLIRFFSSLGDQSLVYGIPILVYQKTGSISASGFAFAIEWIPRLVAMPFSGVATDFFGPKKMLILADFSRFFITMLVGLLLLLELSNTQIIIIFGILGGAIGFFHEMAFVSFETLAPKIISQNKLAQLQSYLQGIDLGTQILAPGFAAIVLAKMTAIPFLGILSFLFLFGLLGTVLSKLIGRNISEINNVPKVSKKKLFNDITSQFYLGIKFVLKSKELIYLCAIAISMNFSIGFLLSGSAGYLKEGLHSSAYMAGYLGTIAGCIGVLGFLLIPFFLKIFTLQKLGMFGVILFFIANISIVFSKNFILFAIFYAIIFLSDGFYSVYMRTLRAKIIPQHIFSSVIGILLCINFIFMPLSGVILGIFGNSIEHFKFVLLLASLLFGIISFLSFKFLNKNT